MITLPPKVISGIAEPLRARRAFLGQVFWTLGIQGAGAIVSFATVAWLGHTYGPKDQGVFSRTKTELEFLASVGSFGLPQALMFYAQNRRLTLRRAIRISGFAALIGATGAVVYALARGEALTAAPLAIAVSVMLWHGNLRTTLLGVSTARLFNVVTALPAILMFFWVLATATVIGITTETTALGFSAAFAAVAIIAYAHLRGLPKEPARSAVTLRHLASYGTATWISAMGVNGTILACTLYTENKVGAVALGLFTATVILAQAALTPLNYLLPILFKRWVGMYGYRIWPYLAVGAVPPLLAAFALRLSPRMLRADWLGPYMQLGKALWLVFAIVGIEVAVRLLAADQLAKGRPWVPAAADILRIAVALFVLMLFRPGDFVQVANVWAAASGAALVALFFFEGYGKFSSAAWQERRRRSSQDAP